MKELKGIDKKIEFFNTHAHCFTLDHVPDYFTKKYLPIRISWLRKYGILRWFVRKAPGWFKSNRDMTERLANFIRFGQPHSQKEVIDTLLKYYPPNTKFAFLSMDMEYMNAGKPLKDFYQQLEELAEIKQNDWYRDHIYPFISADPRRIDQHPEYFKTLNNYIEQKGFQGIKIYPALGYWAFDKRLMPVYKYAIQNDIPVVTHCCRGVVHDRGPKLFDYHPVKTDAALPGKKAKHFTTHYTNPLNYECLLNPKIISNHWEIPIEEAEQYSRLKICLSHFGGSEEWLKFLYNPWVADKDFRNGGYASLEMKNWSFGLETAENQYSWFTIVYELIKKYDNVYTDISYMLNRQECLPVLKVILESNSKIRDRVLFGTDFYMVARAGTERELGFNLRGYLGEELFRQIAEINPKRFLSSKLSPL